MFFHVNTTNKEKFEQILYFVLKLKCFIIGGVMLTLRQMILAHKFRSSFYKGDKKRDAGLSTPDDILRYDNILYGNKGKKKYQLLDVYRPKSAQGKLPVIVSVHGGAWVYGTKDIYQFYCMSLAQRGFVVVNFSYRLAPENLFPAMLEDIQQVFDWLSDSKNADSYGLDLNNVFALGDSAGGHLLSLYTSAITNPEYAKNFPFIRKTVNLKAVALNCGKYEMGYDLENDYKMRLVVGNLFPHKGSKEELEISNGLLHLTKDFPPAYLMTCIGDFLFEESGKMSKAMDAAGIPHEYHCYGSEEKPLWHVFHCDQRLEEAAVCNDNECNYFKKFI